MHYSELLGKRILVDIREFDRGQKLRRSRNFSGIILEAAESGLEIRRDDTGALEHLNVDVEDLEVAEAREYWLRTTGGPVAPPDFIARWIHYDQLPGYARLEFDLPSDP